MQLVEEFADSVIFCNVNVTERGVCTGRYCQTMERIWRHPYLLQLCRHRQRHAHHGQERPFPAG